MSKFPDLTEAETGPDADRLFEEAEIRQCPRAARHSILRRAASLPTGRELILPLAVALFTWGIMSLADVPHVLCMLTSTLLFVAIRLYRVED